MKETRLKFDQILFPTDFSDCSRAVRADVEWLAETFEARVTMVHVFEIPTSWYSGSQAPLLSEDALVESATRAKVALDEYSINVQPERLRRTLFEGVAAEQIAALANEKPFDLIVMGTHGYGPLRTDFSAARVDAPLLA